MKGERVEWGREEKGCRIMKMNSLGYGSGYQREKSSTTGVEKARRW